MCYGAQSNAMPKRGGGFPNSESQPFEAVRGFCQLVVLLTGWPPVYFLIISRNPLLLIATVCRGLLYVGAEQGKIYDHKVAVGHTSFIG